MLSKFSYLLQTSTLIVLVLFLNGCDLLYSNNESHSISTLKEPIYSYALLGPMSDSIVRIQRVSDKSIIYTTQTEAYGNEQDITWGNIKVGSFKVDINSSIEDSDLLLIRVTNGKSIDANGDEKIDNTFTSLKGELLAYVNAKDLREEGVKVTALTTLAALEVLDEDNVQQIKEKLTLYTQKLLRLSIDSYYEIDYKDLYAFTPNYTLDKSFYNPKLYSQLYESGFIQAVFEDLNLTAFKFMDEDSDGLTWESELFIGSNDTLVDSDGDGIADKDEVTLGLNPNSIDTDFDGLNDYEELNSLTDPNNSDSDGDYFSDSYELQHSTDPMNPDEDANGVLDGLDGDPLFKYQWHLKSNGNVVSNTHNISTIVGNDLDIFKVYSYQRGDETSTLIQVVDTGVELIHEDLNIDTQRSYNSINGSNDPSPTRRVSSYDKLAPFEVGHGTAVAGIIGAIANNGVGLRGVVPNAKIVGSNWLEEQSIYELDALWYNSVGANEILVSNNSWGAYKSKDKSFEDIMRLASEQLRDGKGRIFTFASGNDREAFGNANLSYIANNRYAVTVASLRHDNTFSEYSNPGSNILVSAYGGASYDRAPTIATTLLTGMSYYESELGLSLGAITFDDDDKKSYTYAMNGTSAATPMVSGAIALTLESCPDLTWRDVRWLLSYTSKKIDINNEQWVTNSAGRAHNINYGYGLIDTNAMILECRSQYYELLPHEIKVGSGLKNMNVHIPDTNSSVTIDMKISDDVIVEWVELIFDSNHPYAGDYEVVLVSPSGTRTQLITPNELRSDYYKDGFRLSSAAYMGEQSLGTWSVEVTDRLELDSGYVNSLELSIYGHMRR